MLGLSSEALVGTVISIALVPVSFFFGLRAARPKLIATGAEYETVTTQDKAIVVPGIIIHNEPLFLGLRVNRNPSEIKSARLYDPELQDFVGPSLMWLKDHTGKLHSGCTIEAGRKQKLYMFAKRQWDNTYSVYSSQSLNNERQRTAAVFGDRKKDFAIVLFDVIGNEYWFDLTVRNMDDYADITFKLTLNARWRIVWRAFGEIRRAVSMRQ